jgi:hypothetical protein
MSEAKYLSIPYSKDGDTFDFNTLVVPMDFILPLVNQLKQEFQNKQTAAAAPSFRMERALAHERHMKDSLLNGTEPQQQFIDFPVY